MDNNQKNYIKYKTGTNHNYNINPSYISSINTQINRNNKKNTKKKNNNYEDINNIFII